MSHNPGRQRSPLGQLQSNALDPLEARSGTKAAVGASRVLGSRQPGNAARLQGAAPQPASRGSALGPAASGAGLGEPAHLLSHNNLAFNDGGQVEWGGLASPAALTHRTDQQVTTPGVGLLEQATPATIRSVQAWLRSGTPGRAATAGTQRGVTPAIPTPEAWQILEHMPSPGEQEGVLAGIMNAYLRTGAQMLSPEPGYEGDAAIRAPVYRAAAVRPAPPALRPPVAALPPEAPGSVGSQSSEGSCRGGSAPSMARPVQPEEEGLGAEEGQYVMLVGPVHAHDELPSLGRSGGPAGRRSGPPSPISFSLPSDSPGLSPGQGPKTDSPTFSFGMRADGVAQEQPAAAEEAAAVAAAMVRIDSNSSVEQPNPFKAMLCHLRGPQYASPAPAALPRPASPKSPSECAPVLLLPSEVAAAQRAASPAATPELGKGSLTQWINRRGLHKNLNTPARLDLQVLWAAMRDNKDVRSEADAVRAENAALQRELERLQSALRELGVDYHAAVEAAEANQVYAEAEIAKAKEAALQMMELSNQIQQMFNLCEAEKAELMAELLAAQRRLAEMESSGDTGSSSLEQAELEKQIEEAKAAVAAAQRAASLAEARANAACSELLSIRAEMEATQAQLTASAQAQPQATPVGALRSRLQGMQEALEGLQSRQASLASPVLDSKRKVELQQMLAQSKQQLGTMQAMLGGEDEMTQLMRDNQALRQQVQEMSAALAAHTPASVKQQERDMEMRALFGSPTPLRLSAEFGIVSGASPEVYASEHSPSLAGSYSLAPSSVEASPALSDFFSSPYLASQATLTVDYRELHGAVLADTAASRAYTPSITPEHSDDELVEYGSPTVEVHREADEQADQSYTVQCNRLIVTNVPESELSKVKSMVQYWEAVATGTVLPGEGEQGLVDAALPAVAEEISSETALAAVPEEASHQSSPPAAATAQPAVALPQQLVPVAEEEALPQEELALPVAEQEGAQEAAVPESAGALSPLPAATAEQQAHDAAAVAAAEAVTAVPPAGEEDAPLGELSPHCVVRELQSHPLDTPFTAIAATFYPAASRATAASLDRLPEGPAATPAAAVSAGQEAVASTPARFTPLNFAADVSPTPHNTPSASSNATPSAASAPLATPCSAGITPLQLSALRRAGSTEMQAAVRNRLLRIKQDLAKAQSKLKNVDQGLAHIAASPSPSATRSRASSPSCTTPASVHKATPFSGSAAKSPADSTASVAPTPVAQTAAATVQGPAVVSPAAIAQTAAAAEQAPEQAAVAAVAVVESAAEGEEASVGSITIAQTADVVAADVPAAPQEVESAPAPAVAATLSPARQGEENQAANEAVAVTPVATKSKPGVRFAVEEEEVVDFCFSSKPAVVRPSQLGPYASPAGAGSAVRRMASPGGSAARLRMSPGVLRSAVKASPSPLRRAALDSDSDSSGSDSSSDDEDLFDRSCMAMHVAASTPKAAKTPMAHPEGPTATPQSMAFSSTSSFSPPEPLALMSIKPPNRMRRAPAGLAAGRRRPNEVEEREFRRRAAALNIQISPYFRSRR